MAFFGLLGVVFFDMHRDAWKVHLPGGLRAFLATCLVIGFFVHVAAFLTPRNQTTGFVAAVENSPEGRLWMRLLAILLWLGVLPFAYLWKPLNINTASSEELQQVPGIGPATAQKILQMRKSYGPFKSVDDLLAIRGLGEKRLDKMRPYLRVGRTNPPKTEAPSARPTASASPSSLLLNE